MIKLILTDMDGTFLNKEGDYNRTLFKEVKQKLKEKGRPLKKWLKISQTRTKEREECKLC